MTIYPLVPVQRSLDGQIWQDLPGIDVQGIFAELPGVKAREYALALERGEPVELDVRSLVSTSSDSAPPQHIWLRQAPWHVRTYAPV